MRADLVPSDELLNIILTYCDVNEKNNSWTILRKTETIKKLFNVICSLDKKWSVSSPFSGVWWLDGEAVNLFFILVLGAWGVPSSLITF